MNATIVTYNEDGQTLAPRRRLTAHVCWNEKPVILNVEIPIKPGCYLGVKIRLSDIEAEIIDLRRRRKLAP